MCREHRRNTNAFCTASEFNNRIRIRKGEAKTGEGAHTSAHHRKPPTCFLTSPQLPTCTFLPTHGLSLYSRRVSKPPATSDPERGRPGDGAQKHTHHKNLQQAHPQASTSQLAEIAAIPRLLTLKPPTTSPPFLRPFLSSTHRIGHYSPHFSGGHLLLFY